IIPIFIIDLVSVGTERRVRFPSPGVVRSDDVFARRNQSQRPGCEIREWDFGESGIAQVDLKNLTARVGEINRVVYVGVGDERRGAAEWDGGKPNLIVDVPAKKVLQVGGQQVKDVLLVDKDRVGREF